jgi:hypothetical protein
VKVSFNRLAEQELVAAARELTDAANLGAAFLDEYEAWETQVKQHPLSCLKSRPEFGEASCRVLNTTSLTRFVVNPSAFFTSDMLARLHCMISGADESC